MRKASHHLFVSRGLVEAIEDDLRAEVEEEVREEVEEDFRDRFMDFIAGRGMDDELFIGLDPDKDRDLSRAELRAEPMLEARIEWIVERRLEVEAAKLADGVDEAITDRMAERVAGQYERDERLPDVRLPRCRPVQKPRSRSIKSRQVGSQLRG